MLEVAAVRAAGVRAHGIDDLDKALSDFVETVESLPEMVEPLIGDDPQGAFVVAAMKRMRSVTRSPSFVSLTDDQKVVLLVVALNTTADEVWETDDEGFDQACQEFAFLLLGLLELSRMES